MLRCAFDGDDDDDEGNYKCVCEFLNYLNLQMHVKENPIGKANLKGKIIAKSTNLESKCIFSMQLHTNSQYSAKKFGFSQFCSGAWTLADSTHNNRLILNISQVL